MLLECEEAKFLALLALPPRVVNLGQDILDQVQHQVFVATLDRGQTHECL